MRPCTPAATMWSTCQAGLPAMISSTWSTAVKGKKSLEVKGSRGSLRGSAQDGAKKAEDRATDTPASAQNLPSSHDSRICPFMEIQDGGLRALVASCNFTADDCIFDLGCGMGKILHKMLEAFPCYGVGVEVNSSLAKIAEQHLQQYASRACVVVDDVRNVDLSCATAVVSYFLSHSFNAEGASLKERLAKSMRPGSVVLNYTYPIPGWSGLHKNGVYRYTIGQHKKSKKTKTQLDST